MVEILSGATAAQSVAKTVPLPPLQAPGANAATVSKNVSSDFYLSPVIRFDPESLRVIFELRDSQSGEGTKQFPPESVVREHQKSADLAQEPAETSRQTSDVGTSSDASAVPTQETGESPLNTGTEQEVDVLI